MKRFFYLMLLMVTVSIIVALSSCSEHIENDDIVSIGDTAISETEKNEDQSQLNENSEDADKTLSDFEYILLSDETYGIRKLLNTSLTEITVPEQYNGKPVTKIMKKAFSGASDLITLTI